MALMLTREHQRGETFVLLDCGGGTTEAGLYTIAHEKPLRLESEVTHPRGQSNSSQSPKPPRNSHAHLGEVCGSDDLNEAMRKLAMEHLKWETYLEDPETKTTIANIIESDIMPAFEREPKRAFSLKNTKARFPFSIRGLRESTHNPRLCKNTYILEQYDPHPVRPNPMS